ncbi:hypothetical protein OsI_07348 [Oryza sativa Indica Group]|uniref:Uncharacterized protein n=1 Tax=Oryza sativa subsp. indica TaxID=39946 RepID=B8AID3_ORYSI|nr:hypothetical protein OsI_07348 [Oryza sativa Indica Group]
MEMPIMDLSYVCEDCGFLLDKEDVQNHAKTTWHKRLTLCFNGERLFHCRNCDFSSCYPIELRSHAKETGHKEFLSKEHYDRLELPATETPQKIVGSSGSGLWTVKKAAKISAHEQWSPIPFMLLDDEEARELFADDIAHNHKEDKVETDSVTYSGVFIVRSLDAMVMFNADKMNELREKYVIAEGVSSRIALERVQLVLANWNKGIPFCLFSRGANSYKYDEYLKQVTRECLNVYASPNGLISGPLLLFCEGKLLADCSLGGSSGCLIPNKRTALSDDGKDKDLRDLTNLMSKKYTYDAVTFRTNLKNKRTALSDDGKDKDLRDLTNLMSKKYTYDAVTFRTNLKSMNELRSKADIEILMKDKNLEQYILEKIAKRNKGTQAKNEEEIRFAEEELRELKLSR